MRCGICGKRFPFDPDEVLRHAYMEHDFDLVESLGSSKIVLTEIEWIEKNKRRAEKHQK